MLDQKVIELLNDQINKELYSAYLYLDFSNYFMMKDWMDSATGTRSRLRKSVTTLC